MPGKTYYDNGLLTVVLVDMEYHGLKLDINALKAFSELLEQKDKSTDKRNFHIGWRRININSRQLGQSCLKSWDPRPGRRKPDTQQMPKS